MPKFPFEPCIPTKAAKVPDWPEWLHEIKHDGYRLIVQRDGQRVRLFTHKGNDYALRICDARVKMDPCTIGRYFYARL
jgi:ATP-dependent DNA ligase